MAEKKSKLFSTLWDTCNKLRGGMDASEYKNYILPLLFIKFATDKKVKNPFSNIQIETKENDKKGIGYSFDDLVNLKKTKNIGEDVNKVIERFKEMNSQFNNILNVDYNDEEKLGKGQKLIDTLSDIIGAIEGLNFKDNKANDNDIMGDAYEYFMLKFAQESGKSKGQFYTPAAVSRVLAQLMFTEDSKNLKEPSICDPACGSGSLLIRVKEACPCGNLAVYGQEYDSTTAGLAVMNMYIHGYDTAVIKNGDTFSDPQFKTNDGLTLFDFMVANPPFSYEGWRDGITDKEFERFMDMTEELPEKNGDYPWLMHIIKSMKPETGRGAVILPHGVLFRGKSEAKARAKILKSGYIEGIIGFPANIFFGTGIPACVLILDKKNATGRDKIFMIDASRDFVKDGNKNKLRECDIYKIVNTYKNRLEIDKYSRYVSYDELNDDKSLNISLFIDSSDEKPVQDVKAHINGGIPNRDIDKIKYWSEFPKLKTEFFEELREDYSTLKIDSINESIENSEEYKEISKRIKGILENYKGYFMTQTLDCDTVIPKVLLKNLSDTLLDEFKNTILNKYDLYEILHSYWNDVCQDEVLVINNEGWEVCNNTEYAYKANGDVKDFNNEFIPKDLILEAFFKEDLETRENLEASVNDINEELKNLFEENKEDDIFSKAIIDDKFNEEEAEKLVEELEESETIREYLNKLGELKKEKKKLKAVKENILKELADKYKNFTLDDIKLWVRVKWFKEIDKNINSLFNNLMEDFSSEIKILCERYENRLLELEDKERELNNKVTNYLINMGYYND